MEGSDQATEKEIFRQGVACLFYTSRHKVLLDSIL